MSQKIYSDLDVKGSVTISTINSATTDTDKFLVSDGGVVKYRTGAEMLSDLGVAPGVASNIQHQVKAGVAINKGQAVYVTGADGTNMIVGLASNTSEATSSKTMGLMTSTVAINGFGNVVTEGLLAGLDTSTAVIGNPVWLGTNGNLIYGLLNKPYAPAHLVFIGIVTRVNLNNGEIFVKVQNGFELDEIHDIDLKTTIPINGHLLGFNGTLWVNKTIAGWLGYTPANDSNVVHKTFDETIDGNKIFIKDLEVNNMVVGIGAGFVSTNTAIGREALSFNSSGYRNTAIGSRTLRNNTVGFFNTAVGSNALHENISGGENTAIGMQALFKNTTGFYNTAVGVNTLRDNINGSYNTTLGAYNLADNISGGFNVAIGPYAMHKNITGSSNIAVGYEALRQSNASSNTAIGQSALYNNKTGNNNVALGQSALFNNETGGVNLAIGISALFNNKSGGNNIGIGQLSLANLKLGSDNIGIGVNTNLLDKSDSGSIVIGNGATGIGSNKTVLGSQSTIQTFIRGRVTLGSTSDNGVDILQASGYTLATGYKIPSGQSNWFLKANGSYDTTAYQTALTNPVTGSGTQNCIAKFTTNGSPIGNSQIFDNGTNVGIGVGASQLFKLHILNNLNASTENWAINIQNNNNEVNTPTVGIRFNVGDSQSNKAGIIFRRTAGFGVGDLYFLNNGTIDNSVPTIANNTAMVIKSSGHVGIGTTSPTSKLDVSGAIRAFGSGNTGRITAIDTLAGGASISINPQFSTGIPGIETNGDFPMAFYTNSSEKVRITSSGNLGIGTTTPSAKLEVMGTGFFNDSVFIANGAALKLTQNSIFIQPEAVSGSWRDLAFYTNSSEQMRITDGGNVGIGTITTPEKLTVSGYTIATGYKIPSGIGLNVLLDDGNTTPLSSVTSHWTKTGIDIQNNNTGHVQVRLQSGKQLQFLNSASTVVGSINENGVGTYGNSVDYTTVGPIGGNSWIGMNRSQASALFTLGNPQISQPFSLISTNYFGSSYVAGSNEVSASALAEHSFNIGNSVGNGITSGIFRIGRTRIQSTVPIKYATDLSASYDDRTLVDKGYITTSLSGYAIDSNVVHKTGDETIDGNKIFIKDLEVNNMVVGIGSGLIVTNTAIGRNALLLNTTGSKNTAIGSRTLSDNTTGFFNTAVGTNALTKNISGESNTAIGTQALFQVATGSFNTAVGTNTLRDNISAYNTAVGALALADNTSGSSNTAIGTYTIHKNITGNSNTAIGHQALRQSNGSNSVAVGVNAIYNNEVGNNNVALGTSALFDNKTGSANIAIGTSSLYNSRFGSDNIGIGQSTGLLIKTDSGSIIIGNNAVGIGPNKTVLGSPSTIQTFIRGRVTLGTTSDNGVDLLQANGYISATGYKTPGGSSSQYLMANGTTSTAKYKVYTGIMSQTGTSAPAVTVLENTLGGTVVWTYSSVGVYVGTLAGAFTAGKTIVLSTVASSAGATYPIQIITGRQDNNTVYFISVLTDSASTNVDGRINGCPIEIRVYN